MVSGVDSMRLERLAAVSRAVDAVICWTMAPRWCRGKLKAAVKRAYYRSKTERSKCA